MKAMGVGGLEGCSRIRIGEEGGPQGVEIVRAATGEKPGSDSRPVPPMTAILMGSEGELEGCVESKWV